MMQLVKGFPFILLALSMGFALLTLCVFPMIPITVSFFIKRGETKKGNPLSNALIYTLGIVATFSILGLVLALTLGASGANQLVLIHGLTFSLRVYSYIFHFRCLVCMKLTYLKA